MNTYTYDKEPVKEWRQVSDFDAIKECNELKWNDISKILGDAYGFHNSWAGLFSKKKSKAVNIIEKIICENCCYFLPARCFIKHGYELKNLMKRTVHERFNPFFGNLFENCKSTNPTLQLTDFGMPLLGTLAKDIGFNTALDYDEEGILKINFSVLTEEFWRHTRPCYVKEVMKILNIVHAILLSAIEKHEAESVFAGKSYSQK